MLLRRRHTHDCRLWPPDGANERTAADRWVLHVKLIPARKPVQRGMLNLMDEALVVSVGSNAVAKHDYCDEAMLKIPRSPVW
jgi:hypothetical protein